MVTQDEVVATIRACYSRETSADPENWSLDNPALGQCEVASFVFWEHYGGELVLGRVMLDGVQTEHHYWNRVNGEDIDLSRDQFRGDEIIEELNAMDSEAVAAQRSTIDGEIARRSELLGQAVTQRLAA